MLTVFVCIYLFVKCFSNVQIHFTESVSKFFRVGSSQSKSESTPATPKSSTHFEDKYLVRNIDGIDDNISLVSLGSQASLNSHVSSSLGTFDVINRTEDSLPEIEFLADPEISNIKIDKKLHDTIEQTENPSMIATSPEHRLDSNPTKDVLIGYINEQPLVNYTVRFIASKFLLTGVPGELLTDKAVRVSIKSLSLLVLGNCVDFCPHVLLLSLQLDESIVSVSDYLDSIASDDDSSSIDGDTVEEQPGTVEREPTDPPEPSDQLVIKDDHFGESSFASKSYFDFMSPLSKSADQVLLSQLKPIDNDKRKIKLNTDLTDLLSKSDIVESKGYNSIDFGNSRFSSTPKKTQGSINLVKTILRNGRSDAEKQFIEDILDYSKHDDPILRANAITVAGNFIGAALIESGCLARYLHRFVEDRIRVYKHMNLNKLLQLLLKVSSHFKYYSIFRSFFNSALLFYY